MNLGNASLEVHCPAKINWTLDITGQREDGFHNLVSLVVFTQFGDDLLIRKLEGADSDQLDVEGISVPTDSSNLILRAAKLFRERSGTKHKFHFHLKKRIPTGAGLGGGSSDGTNALKAMNELSENILSIEELFELAAELGSDCPLFIHALPCIMKGRGEVVEILPKPVRKRFKGLPVYLMQPAGLPISTPKAYQKVRDKEIYRSEEEANQLLSDWIDSSEQSLPDHYNSFEAVLSDWIPSIPLLLKGLRGIPDSIAGMTGSGSCLFFTPRSGQLPLESVKKEIEFVWGSSSWTTQTSIY